MLSTSRQGSILTRSVSPLAQDLGLAQRAADASGLLQCYRMDTLVAFYGIENITDRFSAAMINNRRAIPFETFSLRNTADGGTSLVRRTAAFELDLEYADTRLYDLERIEFVKFMVDLDRPPTMLSEGILHLQGHLAGIETKVNFNFFCSVYLQNRQYPITFVSSSEKDVLDLFRSIIFYIAVFRRLRTEINNQNEWPLSFPTATPGGETARLGRSPSTFFIRSPRRRSSLLIRETIKSSLPTSTFFQKQTVASKQPSQTRAGSFKKAPSQGEGLKSQPLPQAISVFGTKKGSSLKNQQMGKSQRSQVSAGIPEDGERSGAGRRNSVSDLGMGRSALDTKRAVSMLSEGGRDDRLFFE